MTEIKNPWVRFADTVNKWIGRTISFLLLPITFITSFEVFMRYVVRSPTIWAWDLNIQLSATVILLGGGYTLMENGHVAVDILVINMSPKRRALLDLITSPFFFFGFVILLWYGWEVGWTSFQAREAMPTVWAPPYYPIKLLIPIGALLMLIQGVAKFIRDLHLYLAQEEGESK
jgi:TRAP-type mannitol/chloroaromatic compound transport system permease small subunit